MKYTYSGYLANLGIKKRIICEIPDQVAEAQKEYDGKTFPAILLNGNKIRVKLIGSDYGLWTTGTGDIVVRRA